MFTISPNIYEVNNKYRIIFKDTWEHMDMSRKSQNIMRYMQRFYDVKMLIDDDINNLLSPHDRRYIRGVIQSDMHSFITNNPDTIIYYDCKQQSFRSQTLQNIAYELRYIIYDAEKSIYHKYHVNLFSTITSDIQLLHEFYDLVISELVDRIDALLRDHFIVIDKRILRNVYFVYNSIERMKSYIDEVAHDSVLPGPLHLRAVNINVMDEIQLLILNDCIVPLVMMSREPSKPLPIHYVYITKPDIGKAIAELNITELEVQI